MPVDSTYRFLHSYTQLILVGMLEEENSDTGYGHYFYFYCTKDESMIVKWSVHPGQIQLHYAATCTVGMLTLNQPRTLSDVKAE